MTDKDPIWTTLCELSIELQGLSDICFACSCLFGEREKHEAPPLDNHRMESVFLALSCYAGRISDTVHEMSNNEFQRGRKR